VQVLRWVRTGGATRTVALASFGALLLALAWYSSTHSIDFPVYHRAAVKILHGNYDLYPHAFDEGPLQVDPLGQFVYAPVIAFLFAPLGLLPLQPAAFLFACLKIPAYLYLFWMVARGWRFGRAPAFSCWRRYSSPAAISSRNFAAATYTSSAYV
jgi:hypothetical protein